MKWGIMATGRIAKAFAKGIQNSKNGELVAVGSRSMESAEAFVSEFGGKAHGSYEALAKDPEVEIIYIATPHHTHEADTILCATNGKHVLCEKPFTLDHASAVRAIEVCRANDRFFCEAFMYRFAPQTREVLRLIRSGTIGEVRFVRAEFSYQTSRADTNFRFERELGGGGIMDVGCYCTSMSRAIFDAEPIHVSYRMNPAERGYDAFGAGVLEFPGGKVAQIASGVHLGLDNQVLVVGDEGKMRIESPWFCNGVVRVERNGEPEQILGPWNMADLYGNQIDLVEQQVANRETREVSIEDTLGNMRTLDRIRESCGLHFGA